MHKKPHLFILSGHSGTGKNRLSRQWMNHDLRSWVFLDKDTVGLHFVRAMLPLLGHDAMDRDSPVFLQHIRHLEYDTTYSIARDNLLMHNNVLVCAPMGRECIDEETWVQWSTPWKELAHVHLVWLHVDSEVAKERIIKRNNPMDFYKLEHWEAYIKRRHEPRWIEQRLDSFWCDNVTNHEATLKWMSRRCRHAQLLSLVL